MALISIGAIDFNFNLELRGKGRSSSADVTTSGRSIRSSICYHRRSKQPAGPDAVVSNFFPSPLLLLLSSRRNPEFDSFRFPAFDVSALFHSPSFL